MSPFVGRADALSTLTAVYEDLVRAPGGTRARRMPRVVLVAGEAGMGKTTLLARYATDAAEVGAQVVWGTCWRPDQAPAFWPWTQALRTLLEEDGDLRDGAAPQLSVIVPDLGPEPRADPAATTGDSTRLSVFDAVGRLLGRAVARRPVVLVLDDLQWADRSTLDLLRYLSGVPLPGALLLVGTCRPEELGDETFAELAAVAQTLTIRELSEADVHELVTSIPGAPADWSPLVYRRSGGHPLFARELCHALASAGSVTVVPTAVRELITRRVARVTAPCARMLEVAAVAGPRLMPDVLAEVTGQQLVRVDELVREAGAVGLLAGLGFGHDLYRESIYASLASAQRVDLHHRIGVALVHRLERGGAVFAAEVARHFAAAVPVAGSAAALDWARRAADVDAARFAFVEAAGHLRRARSAITDAGVTLTDAELVDLLAAEADARLRCGDPVQARHLLDDAWQRAQHLGDPARMGTVALGLDTLGARFAMPRTDLVAALDRAREALAATGTPLEANVIAALARQLQHSVPRDRPRARPLAERAVTIARTLADPATLASSLLAHHDTLWTPGTSSERIAIATEITHLAQECGDSERYAQGLLLTATGQLESGSPAFRASMAEFEDVTAKLRQPRHDYLLRTRQAALALLDGDIETGERLSAEAVVLGEAAGDQDTGNVRMSQRLEIARARGDTEHLRHTAAEAVRWWIGAPAHAHAVAAGMLAQAGDLDGARRELDIVLALPGWRTDRSYLWSVYIGDMAVAAVALADRPLCAQILDELMPIADACAVNGALVCFMGAHAHRVGLLHAALGQQIPARQWLQHALSVHRGLGARAWEAETVAALTSLGDDRGRPGSRAGSLVGRAGRAADATSRAVAGRAGPANADVRLHRVGDMWQAGFRGRTAYLRHAKGLQDIAVLLAHPGVEVSAWQLVTGGMLAESPGEAGGADSAAVLDRTALVAYRRRLSELDQQSADADDTKDLGRKRLVADEREHIMAELRRSTRPGGAVRSLGPTSAERARKAVTSRIRDAIERIRQSLPELGQHLDRAIQTGARCSYDGGRDRTSSD